MLTLDLLEPFTEQWLGAADGARAQDACLISFCGRSAGAREPVDAVYDLVTAESLDGLIVWTSVLAPEFGLERLAEFCQRLPLPVVSVGQALGQAPVVLPRDRRAMFDMVSHLIGVHGCRRVAFVRGSPAHVREEERYLGYADALAHHGLAADPALLPAPLESTAPDSLAPVTRMLASGEPPDAIVAANDNLAVAVLSVLASAGTRAPEEVAVVGFGDFFSIRPGDVSFDSDSGGGSGALPLGQNVDPGALSLTTVRTPYQEMGRRAVEVVLAMVRGGTVPDVATVQPELVVRRSCGCLPTISRDPPAAPGAWEVPAARLWRALTYRSDHLPNDWPQHLSAAFFAETGGAQPGAFLHLFEELVQLSLRGGESVQNWRQVIHTLRQSVGGAATGTAQLMRAEDTCTQALTLLADNAERFWRYGQILTEKRDTIVREVGHQLVTSPSVAALAHRLAAELPKLGIPSCYLATYERDPAQAEDPDAAAGTPRPWVHAAPAGARSAWSRLLLAYENGAVTDLTAHGVVYPSVRLVPADALPCEAMFNMVALPLRFADQPLGFVLLEVGPRIGWVYAALQEQLSAALYKAFLVESERAAVAALTEAQRRDERHRLAVELHDSVSQALFSMTLHTRAVQLAVQQQGLDDQNRIVTSLAELRELTQDALTEMRALILELRPDTDDPQPRPDEDELHRQGLVAAVRKHAAGVAAREGLEVAVEAPQGGLALPASAETELFRIVQEAVHNSVKHARPGHISIRLAEGADAAGTLVVEVADDGVGFDPGIPRPGHLGLEGMRERAKRIGGRFSVKSSPGASTTVRVVVPGLLRQQPAGQDRPSTMAV
ncbi:MAG TPA: substrate-binding domain-containing protein [Streptosporangiaceae bacterium]|nr:substrate-binding domain-containing protein [Streptosporangiaceae bacterium]